MGGISTRNFKMFRQLCGDSTLKNVVLVTTMWDAISQAVGEAREAELRDEAKFFKPVIDKGAAFLRHDGTVESGQAIMHYIVNNHPLALRIQRELVDDKKDISQTAAGAELNRELTAQMRKHEEEVRALQQEMRGKQSSILKGFMARRPDTFYIFRSNQSKRRGNETGASRRDAEDTGRDG